MEKTRRTSPRSALTAGFCLLVAILLLAGSKTVSAGVRQGLQLCAQTVIPSLFPFMVLSGFLAASRASRMLNRLFRPLTKYWFRLPESAASPLLMGWIGGYPVGARTLALQVSQHRIAPETAGRMLCYCVNAGPSFLLSAVGVGMLGSLPLGLLLLAAQIGSSLLIGFFLRFSAHPKETGQSAPQGFRPDSVCFVQAVNDASSGMLSICAFVVLFSALNALLTASGAVNLLCGFLNRWVPALDPGLLQAILFGLLEVTTGCAAAASCGYPGLLATAALLSLSGLSVVCQVLAALHGSNIPVRGFLLSRLLHGGLTLALFYLLLRAFPQAAQVFHSASRPIQATAGTPAASLSLILMCAVFLLQAVPLGGQRPRLSLSRARKRG